MKKMSTENWLVVQIVYQVLLIATILTGIIVVMFVI